MIADPTKIDPVPGLGEPLSAILHLAGAVVFLALSGRLIKSARGHPANLASVSVFAFACVFQLAMSGVSHQLDPGSGGNRVLLRLDHAAIFFLIVATLTPIHVILFRGFWRWGFLTIMWSAAVTGIVLKTVFAAQTPTWLGATLYLGFGWLSAISGIMLLKRHGYRFVSLLVYGGMAYSLGLAFEAVSAAMGVLQLIPGIAGGHEVFHVAVLVGMGLHWRFIASFAAIDDFPSSLSRNQ